MKALLVYNDGSKSIFVPHDAAVLIWRMMNGEVEVPENQVAKIARVKMVYLNHKLAPESYLIARGAIDPPPPKQQEMWYQK